MSKSRAPSSHRNSHIKKSATVRLHVLVPEHMLPSYNQIPFAHDPGYPRPFLKCSCSRRRHGVLEASGGTPWNLRNVHRGLPGMLLCQEGSKFERRRQKHFWNNARIANEMVEMNHLQTFASFHHEVDSLKNHMILKIQTSQAGCVSSSSCTSTGRRTWPKTRNFGPWRSNTSEAWRAHVLTTCGAPSHESNPWLG